MIALKQVMVATDFEEAAEAAFAYGRQMARSFGAILHVVHVADDIAGRAASLAGFAEYVGNLDRLQHDAEETARQRIESQLSGEDRQQLGARAVVLTSPAPAAALLDYAKDHAIDLIVTGTHGRGALSHFFMGGVAERLVRSAPCPVLTVHHPQREFVIPDALQTVTKA
jgi:nucleotide-binding universal stress UspA family protein